ncbi:MAG: hypothetical protein EOP10_28445 [Proteobacteria bacterium]|nr:MAG: hypothetical protein EOP10_28445 [Pseudomonadota bacterium]
MFERLLFVVDLIINIAAPGIEANNAIPDAIAEYRGSERKAQRAFLDRLIAVGLCIQTAPRFLSSRVIGRNNGTGGLG